MDDDNPYRPSQRGEAWGTLISQDAAISSLPDPEVEVPTSSGVVMADGDAELPSTPTGDKGDEGEEDVVMETPTRRDALGGDSSPTIVADTSQATPSIEEPSAMEKDQADGKDEQPNGQLENGEKKKERPAFDPYSSIGIIPRSPLEIGLDEQRLRSIPGSLNDAASFEFLHEDHTLGNALRHVIMKNPDVELAGYTIPHPSESKMNIRIQTLDGANAYDALEKGIDDLDDMCDEILKNFAEAKEEYMDEDGE